MLGRNNVMSGILIDRQSIIYASQEIIFSNDPLCEPFRNNFMIEALSDLINAIVLWDDIYVIDYHDTSLILPKIYLQRVGIKAKTIKLKKDMDLFQFIENKVEFAHRVLEIDISFDEVKKWYLSEYYQSGANIERGPVINLLRAYDYIMIASEYNINYMPSIYRKPYVEKYYSHNQMYNNEQDFSRLDLMKKFDKYLIKYYEELKDIIGKLPRKYEFPVLFDYIRGNSNDYKEIIKNTMIIKSNKKVIAFRKELDKLESAFEKGDIIKLKWYFDSLPEILRDIEKELQFQFTIPISVTLIPSFSVGIDFEIHRKNKIPRGFLWLKDVTRQRLRGYHK